MPPALLAQLTAPLSRRDDLAATSAERVPTADNSTQGAFFSGVILGAETARDEFAAIVAEAMKETSNKNAPEGSEAFFRWH